MPSEIATRSPAFVDGKSQNAQELRLHALLGGGGASALASRAGVRPSAGNPGLVASLATPVMKVRVNAGIADIPSTSASGGLYRVSWAEVDLDIDVSSAQARTDLIIVEVVDTGTPAATGKVRVLKGASGAGRPTNPVANAHWFSLAAVAVRVGAETSGNIRAQDVTPEAPTAVAPGAPIPVRNAAERDDTITPIPLLMVLRLDNGRIEMRNAANTGWQVVFDPTAIRKAPVAVTLDAAKAANFGGGIQDVRVWTEGRTVHISGLLRLTAAQAANAEVVVGTIPAGFRPAAREIFPSLIAASSAGRFDVYANGELRIVSGPAGIGLNTTLPITGAWSLD